MEEFINVGKRIPKLDAEEKVTGKAIYIHDLKAPGMLHGKILYSPHPHAKILSIDTSKAEKLPGVKAVLTGYNIPPIKFGVYKDNVPLKAKKVWSGRIETALRKHASASSCRAAPARMLPRLLCASAEFGFLFSASPMRRAASCCSPC